MCQGGAVVGSAHGPRWRARLVLAGVVVAVVAGACSDPIRPPTLGAVPPAPPLGTVPHGVLITPTGVVAPILATFPGGWWVRTPCYAMAAVPAGRVVDHVDVVLDPGHGGPETGAVGPNGLEERVPNEAVAERVEQELEAGPGQGGGLSVQRTHPGTYFVTLRTRGEVAVALQPKAFVSIHHNSVGPPPRRGRPSTEAFFQYASPASRQLAQRLWDQVVAALSVYDIEWAADDEHPGPKTRVGEHGDYYGILRYSAGVPAAIVEGSFTSNLPEAELQATDEYRRFEAAAITRAIRGFVASGVDASTPAPAGSPPTTASPNGVEPPGIPDDAVGCTDPPLSAS